jgi:hypothetical protein
MTDAIKVSTEGITAQGYISWAVIGLIAFYIYMKYGHRTVKHVMRTKIFNRRKTKR